MITYGDIIKAFHKQFKGLNVNDIRPNGVNEIYIWLNDSPVNLIATYCPDQDTFIVKSTRDEWGFMK